MNFYKNSGKFKGLYRLRGHIEDDEKHYLERIKPLFEKLFQTKINIRKMPSTRVVGFQIWNDNLVSFKEKLGLPKGKKFEIEIPEKFLLKNHLKKSVLKGIFDTDGGIYLQKKYGKLYPRLYITTISKKLSEQLLEAFIDEGFRITRYSQLYNKKFNRQRSYILTIRGVKIFHKFMKEISPKNPKHIEKYKIFIDSQNL